MATTPAVSDVKYSMLVVPADGVTRQYEFNFAGGYISRDHIKIQYENDSTGAITPVTDLLWVNANTIALGTAVTTIPVGNTVTVYRDTPKDQPLVDYTDGAIINAANLDRSFDQAIFASAEMVDRFLAVQDVSETANSNALAALTASASATATANTAATNASNALTQAGQAVATANTANSNAATALSTANGIDAKATTALANSAAAVSTANGVDAKATTALANSNTAVTTANAASTTANAAQTTANAIDGKATTALTNSAAAVSTANTAQSTAAAVDTKAQTALDNSAAAVTTANGASSAVTALNAVAVKQDSATGGANLPVGTTAQRPSSPGANRPIRYNSTTNQFEGYTGTNWAVLPGAQGARAFAASPLDTFATRSYTVPAGTSEVDFLLSAAQHSSSAAYGLRLGTSAGYITTGYQGTTMGVWGAGSSQQLSDNFLPILHTAAGQPTTGVIRLRLIDAGTNTWVIEGSGWLNSGGTLVNWLSACAPIVLPGELTAVALVGATGNFTGGVINRAYR